MKYEFSDQVAYLTLHTPASQHPPLWPVLAGVLAKITANDDTFSILKLLSEITGLLLIGVTALVIKRASDEGGFFDIPIANTTIVAVSLVCFSAVLIDFSANGSPYILMALWLVLSSGLLQCFNPQKSSHIIAAGILCALGFLMHSALALLPVGFLYVILKNKTPDHLQAAQPTYRNSRLWQIFLFLLVISLGLTPWFVWNVHHFGRVLYSYSSYYLLDQLGLVRTGIYNDIITSRLVTTLPIFQIFQSYFWLVTKSIYAFCREFIFVVGPFGLILFLVGFYQGVKVNKGKTFDLLLPSALYWGAIILWATYKFRFLIPLIPAFSIFTALGFVRLYSQGKIWRWVAGLCLGGTLAWFLLPIFQGSRTLYYGQESQAHDIQYAEMQPLASSLATWPPGVVLGYAQSLDGGIETVYWHGLPFVAGRGLGELEIKKLVADFDIRYIWVDATTLPSMQAWFPSVKLIDQSGEFAIFELP